MNFKNRRNTERHTHWAALPMRRGAGLPLPSTGRGNEGEGWFVSRRQFANERAWLFPPLSPALSPLREEGDGTDAFLRHKTSDHNRLSAWK